MPKIIEDEQIFRAVIEVISERGYAGAATKQMAEAAGVSEVTLFRKYGNKAELVRQAISSIVAQTDFSSAVQYTGDLHADLLRVVHAYQESAVKHGFFLSALISELSRYPEVADALDQPLRMFSLIEKLVVRYQKKGSLQEGSPTLIVAALLAPLIFPVLFEGARPDSRIPPRDLSAYLDAFLHGYQTGRI
jgi:AcrR family transcriptional regulator